MSRKIAALAELDDYLVKIEGWDCEKMAPTKRDLAERDVSESLASGETTSSLSDYQH